MMGLFSQLPKQCKEMSRTDVIMFKEESGFLAFVSQSLSLIMEWLRASGQFSTKAFPQAIPSQCVVPMLSEETSDNLADQRLWQYVSSLMKYFKSLRGSVRVRLSHH